MKSGLLTTVAMLAFAANSVLARLALAGAEPNALAYTGIRLIAGAGALAVLVAIQPRPSRMAADRPPPLSRLGGAWLQAAALFGYAIAFSLAYLLLGAATGALVLFASVQFGMLAWAILRGERPSAAGWLGLGIALCGLAYLVSPGLAAPDPVGASLMVGAGLCWAAYSLAGRGSTSPLTDTAGNFLRCLPFALLAAAAGLAAHPFGPAGIVYAILSGAIASGFGYAVWYKALPMLTRSRAAIVQLTVPAIAAAGGVIFIGEPLSFRLIAASFAILGGVALAIAAR